jgi:MAF protein
MVSPCLLLASVSPRRRELLSWLGWSFDVSPADINEDLLPGERPDDYVLRLAQAKARRVGGRANGCLVIAADTTVADGMDILGKPEDEAEAKEMLLRLRGRQHQVYTGVSVYDPSADRLESEVAVSQVTMRSYSAEELDAYIASGDPFDKAGGYAIQHNGFHPVSSLEGCYTNVMGLPVCTLARLLSRFGLIPKDDRPLVALANLGYKCADCESVYPAKNGQSIPGR